MCETNVYVEKDGKQEILMKDVISITPVDDKLLLVDLFGEQKQIKAEFKELKLLEHMVILEPKE
ncbi:MAG: RNA-binding protein [Candidatus Aquicultor secundus]|uniref:RNA-binding protein n=1 Tax=Candidatus Aquicultor secundus TaxID=1973895 RepID=A0A2M7T687_9ACTN|nr:CooT family nickel-binding protein [Candidatus Aquicultor secundus]NCO66761.1 CooT family nickel-binding protein [Solirubrobacter sp.]OIO88645.1 MAG: RNA-binding protein [Candidatus Aquicultor secundus]PIW22119.1 MAG: RNA-binding protein [Candidatus Aquicultor secundus]PIX53120.1 MAG: RNA-binding protein [Candidatus Aquicultor secundus]PIY39715.1 MAG: RNA-binding protein [Candidatus Aquicultor secundus]